MQHPGAGAGKFAGKRRENGKQQKRRGQADAEEQKYTRAAGKDAASAAAMAPPMKGAVQGRGDDDGEQAGKKTAVIMEMENFAAAKIQKCRRG